ncbi:MAG: FGGY family carbohydrate kinase [Actinobacteria bacterium]|nr:FGGY family carbohydrate kinase [Actinomycetota bacterium]
MKYIIGVDLGTTLAKCVIYNQEGNSVAEAGKEMNIRYPGPGQAEQDAEDFYTVTCELLREVLLKSKIDKNCISGISIDSQMGGIMAIDKNYNPVIYYDTPLDSRSAGENNYMHQNFGDLIIEKNGSYSTFGNKILYWKKKNQWRDIHKFIQPSAFVSGKLAGLSGDNAYMDESFLCFSGLADLKNSIWSDELCEKLKVDTNKLPRIVKSTEIIGLVTKKASEDTGLPKGIPVCAGCGDQSAGFIGAGIIKRGQMVDVSGTACILGACINDFRYDGKNKTLACMKSALGKNYYLISVVLAGRTHKWFVDEFFAKEKEEIIAKGLNVYDYLDGLAENINPGSDGLLAIDYLQGRFFPPNPAIRGLFIGHTWAHKKIHFYRSILESIAYDHYLTREIIRELVPDLDFEVITAIGSAAKSILWMQMKSDILQIPYQNLHRSDLSTLGSALIAGYSTGIYKDYESDIKRIIKSNLKIIPKENEDEKYLRYIDVYKNLFFALKDIYKKLVDIKSE